MKISINKLILLPLLLLTINLFAQTKKTVNEKMIADSLKLSNKIASKKAQFVGYNTTLNEMTEKLQILKTEKDRKMLRSQETGAKIQSISASSTTERDARRLARKANKARREAIRLKRSLRRVGRQEFRIEKVQKKQFKLQKSIDKNQSKIEKLRKKLN